MRKAEVKRKTKETEITLKLNIDGKGSYAISTGITFLDHMLSLFSKHGLFDLNLKAKGDLDIDLHHTNEDIGIVLGEAFKKALGKKKNIKRFAWAFAVLDEAKVRVILDLSGRPYLEINPPRLKVPSSGYSFKHFKDFMRAFVNNALITLHIDILKGEDFHHILECVFKALGLALDEATLIDKRKKGIPSTKGRL